ncbi:OprD family outer membrane porin [Pseudodesulfovibrio sp.]|uniref:OprD family outer membrane porin n=1 Tax=unclassified Pseudodesulfovibrio TaxID=2661612 RepID=UPI003B006691
MSRFPRLCLLICFSVLSFALTCAAAEKPIIPEEYGTISGQFRTYYFTQRNKDTRKSFNVVRESLAVGGYLKYESPWIADHFGAGVAGYISEPFINTFNQDGRGGTGLLSSRNQGIHALGEAYLKARYAQSEARVWRQRIDTPFINSDDSRMLPKTFEAYGIKSKDVENLELNFYWVDKEKDRDTELFKPMTEIAGMNSTQGGVLMTGADWQPMNKMPLRFWNYYAPDMDNTFFTQAKYTFGEPKDIALELMFQGVDQRSVGEQLRGRYNAAEAGMQGKLMFNGFDFYLGASKVDGARGIRNSWGTYPFFNNLMAYNFARSGEASVLVGVGYDFSRIGWNGFKANIKAATGKTPDQGVHASFDRNEYNLNMEYNFDGAMKGWSILNRWSYQDADENLGGQDGYQVRMRLQYNF